MTLCCCLESCNSSASYFFFSWICFVRTKNWLVKDWDSASIESLSTWLGWMAIYVVAFWAWCFWLTSAQTDVWQLAEKMDTSHNKAQFCITNRCVVSSSAFTQRGVVCVPVYLMNKPSASVHLFVKHIYYPTLNNWWRKTSINNVNYVFIPLIDLFNEKYVAFKLLVWVCRKKGMFIVKALD